jgi:hypothetical protein
LPSAGSTPASRVAAVAKRILLSLVLLIVLVYASDYVFVRVLMAYPKLGDALGSVQMERLYAIPQKNGKTEYEFDARQPVVTMPCVHSLFPHLGNKPCWYLRSNSEKPVPM